MTQTEFRGTLTEQEWNELVQLEYELTWEITRDLQTKYNMEKRYNELCEKRRVISMSLKSFAGEF
jgi:hypothetical protein